MVNTNKWRIEQFSEIHYDITPIGRFSDIVESWESIAYVKDRVESIEKIFFTHELSLLDNINTIR